jgi:hypothetical protein
MQRKPGYNGGEAMFYGKELSLLLSWRTKPSRGRPRFVPGAEVSDDEVAWLRKYRGELEELGNSYLAWYFQAAVRRECAMTWFEQNEEPRSAFLRKQLEKLGKLIEDRPVVTLSSIKEHGLTIRSFRELEWFYDGARRQPVSSVSAITKTDLKYLMITSPFVDDPKSDNPVLSTVDSWYVRIRKGTPLKELHADISRFTAEDKKPWSINYKSLRSLGVLPYIDLLFWENRHGKAISPTENGRLICFALYDEQLVKSGAVSFSSGRLARTHRNTDAFMDITGKPARSLLERARRELIATWRKNGGKGDGRFVDYEHRFLGKQPNWDISTPDRIVFR